MRRDGPLASSPARHPPRRAAPPAATASGNDGRGRRAAGRDRSRAHGPSRRSSGGVRAPRRPSRAVATSSDSRFTLPVLPHELPPVDLLGVEQIVGLTRKAKVLRRRGPSQRGRPDVVHLELPAAVAAPAVRPDPGAAAAVPLPHLPSSSMPKTCPRAGPLPLSPPRSGRHRGESGHEPRGFWRSRWPGQFEGVRCHMEMATGRASGAPRNREPVGPGPLLES
jgi:hypothetical protein